MSDTKYYKTVVKVVILSDRPYNNTDLSDMAYDITEGDCSGQVDVQSQEELSGKAMADALIEQGSEPSFLGLDDEGNDIYEKEQEEDEETED